MRGVVLPSVVTVQFHAAGRLPKVVMVGLHLEDRHPSIGDDE